MMVLMSKLWRMCFFTLDVDICGVDLDLFDVDLVFLLVLDDVIHVDDVSLGDADVDLVDFAVTDLDEEDVVDVFLVLMFIVDVNLHALDEDPLSSMMISLGTPSCDVLGNHSSSYDASS